MMFLPGWTKNPSAHPDWEAARRAGMSRSVRIREHLDRVRPAAHAAAARTMANDPRFTAGPGHQMAMPFALVSPDLTLYVGRNLADFVRTHHGLFRAVDLVATHPSKSRAYAGLISIIHGRSGSWKGWTLADPQDAPDSAS